MKHFVGFLFLVLSLTVYAEDTVDIAHMVETGVIIDVRTVEEWDAGHIEGANLIPLEQVAAGISDVAADKDTPVLLYCRSGRRAGVAQETLLKMGYTNVVNLGGIIDAQKTLDQLPD